MTTGFAASILAALFFAKIYPRVFEKRIFTQKSITSLRQDEQIIHQRLQEFEKREKSIQEIRQQVGQISDINQRQVIEQTLNKTTIALHSQRDQYIIKSWEIQLIRWYNPLKPLLNSWIHQDESTYHDFYPQLKNVFEEGEKLLSEWKQHDLATTNGGQETIHRLTQALDSCRQFYQAIAANQAVNAIKDINRFNAQLHSGPQTKVELEDLDVFNALPDVEAFSPSLQKLEKEYFDFKSNTAKIKILFLGANPSSTARLKLGDEVQGIKTNLKLAKKRKNLELEQEWAVTIDTLMQSILDESPDIVHFSGHGKQEGVILQNEIGEQEMVSTEALSNFFRLFKDSIKCVILNSCYSESQARAIKLHIPYVIGMKAGVSDKAAIAFSTGFYKAIGAGKDIPFSFELGIAAMKLKGVSDNDIPILLQPKQA